MPTILCLGEALVDFVADVNGVSLIECPGFRKAAGGAVGNVAVGLARLGTRSVFLGKVGDDPFGHFLEQTFRDAGVDTRWMLFDREARTGLAFVSLQADGERDFVFFRNPSADMLHRASEVPDEALADCCAYHFGSISLIQEPSRHATLETLRRAREAGALISFDPNLRPPLWPSLDLAREQILAALPLADLVKISAEEGDFLFGESSAERHSAALIGLGAGLAAVTRRADGCLLATAAESVWVPGYAVDAVDTTGAGDGFVAALLHRLAERGGLSGLGEDELRVIGQFANAVGAVTCTRKGAIPALPTLDEARRFAADGLGVGPEIAATSDR